jgi:hypothetical protein
VLCNTGCQVGCELEEMWKETIGVTEGNIEEPCPGKMFSGLRIGNTKYDYIMTFSGLTCPGFMVCVCIYICLCVCVCVCVCV